MSWDDLPTDSLSGWPLTPLRRRLLGLPPDDEALRAEARVLLEDLADRGIALRLVDDHIRWSTWQEPLTLGEMRQIKRLAPALMAILGGEP